MATAWDVRPIVQDRGPSSPVPGPDEDSLVELLTDSDMLRALFRRIDETDGDVDGIISREGWLTLVMLDEGVRIVLRLDMAIAAGVPVGEKMTAEVVHRELLRVFARMPPVES
jgi:hypothetical protein